MLLREIIEGRFDPYQNKAIFFAGVPGAGKTFIARRLASIFYGLKQVNPDAAFKYLLKNKNLSLKMPPEEEIPREIERQRSKQIVGKQQQIYQQENLGMLIDTTGRSLSRVVDTKEELEAQGYDTAMIYVDADIETSVKRNRARERSIPEKVLMQNFGAVKANVPRFQELFGDRFFEIDNSLEKQSELPQNLKDLEYNIKQFLNK
jgi:cytidylate kinase